MRINLLKMVQLILSSMDSDEVNDISDTVEASQVTDIIETTYYDLAATIDFPDHWNLFELDPSNDPSRPTMMKLPDRVAKVEWIKYDVSENPDVRDLKDVFCLERERFFDRMNSLDSSREDIYRYNYKVGPMTFDVRGYNNRNPVYYTTVDDRTLIFDNYDLSRDDTLMANKTHCYGMLIPEFRRENTFIPDLEPRQFTLLFNEAKSQAFADIKQTPNAKAEQRARRGWVQAHRKSPQTGRVGEIYWDYTWNFGRNVRGRR